MQARFRTHRYSRRSHDAYAIGVTLEGVQSFRCRGAELRAGDAFYISPEPHDSWVLGDSPYISLHMLGVSGYAKV